MRYDHVTDNLFIICHFIKIMCNDTDLVSRESIDNIKRHDSDYEKDNASVVIGNIFQHELRAYEVVCIVNSLVESKKIEGSGQSTINLLCDNVKQSLINYYTSDN